MLALFAVLAPAAAAAQARGWTELSLGGGARATRYLPVGVELCAPAPLAVFLHGAGGTPEAYHGHLEAHAEALGLVLVLPQAAGAGWGGGDVSAIVASMDAVRAELRVDERRIYLAGHSAGGAFAYLLAYEGSEGIAAVFSMSAPYYAIGARSDPSHAAPIRMYYGADDPNYTGGSAAALEAQWVSLGVPYATDVQPGYGHSTWPPASIRAGLESLLAVRYPGAPTPSTCPDADAGVPGDAGGPDAGPLDAGVISDAAAPRPDAGSPAAGDGGAGGGVEGGCACQASGPRDAGALFGALVFIFARRTRRTVVNSPVVVLTPNPVTSDDNLLCTASGSDVDGDAVAFTYSWTVNGAIAGSGATLAHTTFGVDDVMRCTATPYDGIAAGASGHAETTIQ